MRPALGFGMPSPPPGSEGPWTAEGPKLSALARRWRAEAPDRVWLAGRRPPPERLGEGGFLLRGSPEPAKIIQDWVLEMWGYSIAAAKVGLKHQEFRNFQVEPSPSPSPSP